MDDRSVWDLFIACFAIGDECVVVDEWDQVIVGKLTEITEDDCTIVSVFSQKKRKIDWDTVVFFCHDGFPMKKMRFVGAEALAKLDTEDTQDAIRKALTHDYDNVKQKWVLQDGSVRHPVARIIRGDPFLIEDITASIYHPGNCGSQHWMTDHEETILLESPDGAKANMYHLPSVFHAEISHG